MAKKALNLTVLVKIDGVDALRADAAELIDLLEKAEAVIERIGERELRVEALPSQR